MCHRVVNAAGGDASGIQTTDRPLVAHAPIHDAVVQSRGMTLPELDRCGANPKAAPVRWARHDATCETLFEGVVTRVEGGAVGERLTLLARPGTELIFARSFTEVLVVERVIRGLDRTLDPQLTVEVIPVHEQRSMPLRGELASLAALVIREENRAMCIECAQQNGTERRLRIRVD